MVTRLVVLFLVSFIKYSYPLLLLSRSISQSLQLNLCFDAQFCLDWNNKSWHNVGRQVSFQIYSTYCIRLKSNYRLASQQGKCVMIVNQSLLSMAMPTTYSN